MKSTRPSFYDLFLHDLSNSSGSASGIFVLLVFFSLFPSVHSSACLSVCLSYECFLITSRNSSCGKVMFSQACVKKSVHRADEGVWQTSHP